MNNLIIYFILAITGLALGSFINALVWRFKKQSSIRTRDGKLKYSIVSGRSMCPSCKHPLGIMDLIPVFSWLYLRGKCRYCQKSISVQYPIVEILTTILFILSYLCWPIKFDSMGVSFLIIWLAILVNLIALAVYDIRWLKLPNRMMHVLYALVGLQLLATIIFFGGRWHFVLNSLLGLIIGGGIFYLLFQLSSGKWIGGGDVKLGAVLGLYLGSALDGLLMIFFASVLGSLLSIPLLAAGKLNRKTLIPYGPFLILAAVILRLFGGTISSWLKTKGIVI